MQIATDIVPLASEHVAEAARTFVARYRAQRLAVPALPAAHEDQGAIEAMLRRWLADNQGVAAVRGGEFCGYLIGTEIAEFMGANRGAYCPVWAHGAEGDDRASVYHWMYAALAERWVRDGCLTHAITISADDGEAQAAWCRDGFGMQVVDAVRSLEPIVAQRPVGAAMRRATPDDLPLILTLDRELSLYMAGAPTFLAPELEGREEEYRAWLAEPAHVLWLATYEGEAIAYMRCQPPTYDVAYVVRDPGTISITGAYVRPRWRRGGVAASLLLQALLAWAAANGYERCAVDFESHNLPGSRFWSHFFQPVCHSLVRRLDPQALAIVAIAGRGGA
jgi:GNAT superfamily N-acetyltransferase